MIRFPILLVMFLFALLPSVNAQNMAVGRARAATIRKIEALFGQQYRVEAQHEPKPAEPSKTDLRDTVIYWFGANHVVRFSFTSNGILKLVELMPEEWLCGDSHTDNPNVELSTSQMDWLIKTVDRLRPVGKPRFKTPYGYGFVSGANRYCVDGYERASVSHYWRDERDGQSWRYALKSVSILYR